MSDPEPFVDIDGTAFRWTDHHDIGEVLDLLTCAATMAVSGVVVSRCGLCHQEFVAGDDCIADVMDEWREAVIVRFWHQGCAEVEARRVEMPN